MIRGITIPSPEETMSNKTVRNHGTYASALLIALSLLLVSVRPAETQNSPATTVQNAPAQIHALKVTLLSTMLVGATTGLGEWGFAALIEADGHRVLLDTGAHPDTVLQNAGDLKIDLSDVREVILTHNHWDHVSGLMTLRREMMKKNPSALSVVHVSRGIHINSVMVRARCISHLENLQARFPKLAAGKILELPNHCRGIFGATTTNTASGRVVENWTRAPSPGCPREHSSLPG
jgi:hypothetical protein